MQFSLRDFFLLVSFFLSFSRRLCTSLRMLTAIRKPPCTTRYMVIISLARQSYRKTAPVFEAKEKQVHEERKNKYMSNLKAYFFSINACIICHDYIYVHKLSIKFIIPLWTFDRYLNIIIYSSLDYFHNDLISSDRHFNIAINTIRRNYFRYHLLLEFFLIAKNNRLLEKRLLKSGLDGNNLFKPYKSPWKRRYRKTFRF